ncbi:DUF7289 family protein [Halobaculum gomorrense]|uniref:Flagellin N-terminal-like domain-containing protein n=1 Tax=Halobaculum gomorrense TaxID=43928 RepID=A0A1M5JJI1_9EURY|nr:hypothetical protein [Halobaculum gomorrense]SHG40722.1 hypothetical protein SAMN05443636_0138 [Halobaculum gomorrense]
MTPERSPGGRAQSHVIGVALLLGITALSMAGLTATVGTVVESNTAGVDAGRVSADLDAAFAPVEVTGHHRGIVSYTDGRLRTVERTVRILNASGEVRRVDAGGVVWSSHGHRVAFVAGAVVRGPPGNAVMDADPALALSARTAVVGVAVLGDARFSYAGGGRVPVSTRVSHSRTVHGDGEWRVAVETATARPWRAFFEQRGAVTSVRDFDGDGVDSVVARFPGTREFHLVVHRLHAEAGR